MKIAIDDSPFIPPFLDTHAATPSQVHSLAWNRIRASRRNHIGHLLQSALRHGVKQFVCIRSDVERSPLRLVLNDAKFFELRPGRQLKLSARNRSGEPRNGWPPYVTVPCNFEHSTVFEALALCPEYQLLKPALFILEGESMYVKRHWLVALIQGLKPLLAVKGSRLWLDVAHRRLTLNHDESDEITRFVRGLVASGEGFATGYDDPGGFFRALRLQVEQNVPACFEKEWMDPVFGLYRFLVLSKPTPAR